MGESQNLFFNRRLLQCDSCKSVNLAIRFIFVEGKHPKYLRIVNAEKFSSKL